MKLLLMLTVLLVSLTGCRQEAPPEDLPAVKSGGKVVVSVGESYDEVISKLGMPNVDSASDTVRVLIYDKIELKLEEDIVVKVYDHRAE